MHGKWSQRLLAINIGITINTATTIIIIQLMLQISVGCIYMLVRPKAWYLDHIMF